MPIARASALTRSAMAFWSVTSIGSPMTGPAAWRRSHQPLRFSQNIDHGLVKLKNMSRAAYGTSSRPLPRPVLWNTWIGRNFSREPSPLIELPVVLGMSA